MYTYCVITFTISIVLVINGIYLIIGDAIEGGVGLIWVGDLHNHRTGAGASI